MQWLRKIVKVTGCFLIHIVQSKSVVLRHSLVQCIYSFCKTHTDIIGNTDMCGWNVSIETVESTAIANIFATHAFYN